MSIMTKRTRNDNELVSMIKVYCGMNGKRKRIEKGMSADNILRKNRCFCLTHKIESRKQSHAG